VSKDDGARRSLNPTPIHTKRPRATAKRCPTGQCNDKLIPVIRHFVERHSPSKYWDDEDGDDHDEDINIDIDEKLMKEN